MQRCVTKQPTTLIKVIMIHSTRQATSPLGTEQQKTDTRRAPARTSLIREARLPVRRLKAAWAAVSSEASRLKHDVIYRVRATVVEHFAAPVASAMDEKVMALHQHSRHDRFDTTVSHQKWNKGSGSWITKTDVSLFDEYLNDSVLTDLQYRYVEELARIGIHTDHTSVESAVQTRDRPLSTLDEHIATIRQMVDRLSMHLELELTRKSPSRNTDVIAKMRQHIRLLKQEKLHLQQRTRPLLKDWLGKGNQVDPQANLAHLIEFGTIPQAEAQSWVDHNFSLLTALKAHQAGVGWADFAQWAGVDAGHDITEHQRESILYLVDAKEAMPAVSADDFKQLAPMLLQVKTPLDTIRLMSNQKIVQNAHTWPETVHPAGTITKLGAGSVNTVYRVPLQDGTVQVLKGEGAEVSDQGTNAGIGEALNGANLSGRTLVSAAVAKQLGIRSAPSARPVVLEIPEKGLTYGTLSDFVPGAALTSGVGESASIPLTADQYAALQGLTPDVLNGIALAYGFKTAELEPKNGSHELRLSTRENGQFATPLDLKSPQVRESASNLGFWAAITGQVDLHGNNVKLVPGDDGVELVSFDNDMSAGSLHHHPNSRIANSQAHHEKWRHAVDQCVVVARSGSQEPIDLPETIGSTQREAILAMTRDRFLARYQSAGLDRNQQDQAWTRLQGIQYNLRTEARDGTLRIPVAAVEWEAHGIGMTTSSGIPRVISASLKARILALDEATVRDQMFGALGPAERSAGWSRVMAIQDELSIPGHIQVVDTTDAWSQPAVTQAMGLEPSELEATARKAAGQDDFDAKATLRGVSMNHGILAAWGVTQTVSRLCAEGSKDSSASGPTPLTWAANQGAAAWFDSEAILKTALTQAGESQENA